MIEAPLITGQSKIGIWAWQRKYFLISERPEEWHRLEKSGSCEEYLESYEKLYSLKAALLEKIFIKNLNKESLTKNAVQLQHIMIREKIRNMLLKEIAS